MPAKINVSLIPADELALNEGIIPAARRNCILEIAAACHQQNRLYCQMHGDQSQVTWEETSALLRRSVVKGVEAALLDPDPAASHERWVKHQASEGWVYGEEKDERAKTHPLMRPYGELPPQQQCKDALFIEMVQQVALAQGLLMLRSRVADE